MMNIGDIIDILDNVDLESITSGTIRKIEPDIEMEGLYYYYIRANNEELNTLYDPTIGNFWRLIESDSEYII